MIHYFPMRILDPDPYHCKQQQHFVGAPDGDQSSGPQCFQNTSAILLPHVANVGALYYVKCFFYIFVIFYNLKSKEFSKKGQRNVGEKKSLRIYVKSFSKIWNGLSLWLFMSYLSFSLSFPFFCFFMAFVFFSLLYFALFLVSDPPVGEIPIHPLVTIIQIICKYIVTLIYNNINFSEEERTKKRIRKRMM